MGLKEDLERVLEYTSYEDIEKDLKAAGWECPVEIETNDEIQEYSTDVSWNSNFIVSKNDKSFNVYLSGEAIAEISYGSWCTTFGYNIEDFEIVE